MFTWVPRVNTVFVPMMASRLMLSLKKAAIEPNVPWSLKTMSDSGRRTTLETIHFASWALDGSHEISGIPTLPSGRDIELESISRLPRDRG